MPENSQLPIIEKKDVGLDRDRFLRTLVRELSGTLQEIVGLDEAAGFVSMVGQSMGDQINELYREAFDTEKLDREQIGATLVDLKRRIEGDFFIISQDDDKIVLGNRMCPFGDKVLDRPSLCMMTSNVFGVITADNLGYAKVSIEEAIANHDPGCRVVVYLRESEEAAEASGREYFADES